MDRYLDKMQSMSANTEKRKYYVFGVGAWYTTCFDIRSETFNSGSKIQRVNGYLLRHIAAQ